METQVEVLENSRVKVTATVPAKTVDAEIKKMYKKLANRYNVPGFRKGKVPRPVLDNACGRENILGEVTDEIVNGNYPLIIDEQRLSVVGSPEFPEDLPYVADGEDFTFSFEISIRPEFELTSYDRCEVVLPPDSVKDEEIDNELTKLCENYFDFEDAPEGAAAYDTDRVVLKQTALLDSGRNYEGLCSENFIYGIGNGLMPASYDKELLGLKIGDAKEFEIDMPSETTAYTAGAAGLTDKLRFTIEVIGLKRKSIPEADEAFATKKLGFESLEALRERIRENLAQAKGEDLPQMKETQCRIQLSSRLQGEVPEGMIEAEEVRIRKAYFQGLQENNLTLDAFLKQQDMTREDFDKDIKARALEDCKVDLALDAWARHFELQATEEDVKKAFAHAGVEDPEGLLNDWRNSGRLHEIRDGISRDKAMVNVLDGAVRLSVDDVMAPCGKPIDVEPEVVAEDAPAAEEPEAVEAE